MSGEVTVTGFGVRGAPVTVRSAEAHDTADDAGDTRAPGRPGSIQGLFDLATAHRRLLRDGGSHLLVTGPEDRRGPTAFTLTADTVALMNETETHAHQ